MTWAADRASINDLSFRLEHAGSSGTDRQGFVLHKTKPLVDQYELLFDALPAFHPDAVLELGIWKGGSVVFWHEVLRPKIHVAIDIEHGADSANLERYVLERGSGSGIRLLWGCDQQDRPRLRAILRAEFAHGLDLVIDDASHLYRPTLASFEVLFPCLRPGGLYIVEDWAWTHWQEFSDPGHPWANERALTDFVHALVEATGTSSGLIRRIFVHQGFVAIERGSLHIPEPDDFALADHIRRRISGSAWSLRHAPKRALVSMRSLFRQTRHFLLRRS